MACFIRNLKMASNRKQKETVAANRKQETGKGEHAANHGNPGKIAGFQRFPVIEFDYSF